MSQQEDRSPEVFEHLRVRNLEDLPPLLTPKEVSIAFRRSLSGVYEDARSGPLKSIAVHWGSRVFIPRDALIDLIMGGEL